ncbi:MAG TPA: efflux RND transporter periplasmic adaptor subunit [Xanthobacteraceae bacterium]|nr:efflux RND transporter periplasmic adaptor subunit [Xanthobacteraceae bacterium]
MGQGTVSPISSRPRRLVAILATAAVAVVAFAAVITTRYTRDARAGLPPAASAGVPVSIGLVKPQSVHPFAEFSGRINAVDYAEIKPQVAGRITEIRFHDGDRVNAGDVLFVIDPRPYQATVDKAQADLVTAIANVKYTKAERERGSQLVKNSDLSQETFDQRANAEAVAQASLQSAQAALESAKLNLDYAYVKAPITGRISRAEITLGNLVGSPTTAPQLLASIVSDNGVYADFEVDEQTYLEAVRNYGQTQEQEQKIPVDVVARGDEAHVTQGHILSFDNRINTGSGTIRARARFDNADGRLIPGMYVSVRMGAGMLDDALLVPENAIGNDQSKRFVFVVGDGDKAEYRTVQLGPQIDGNRVILTGIKSGDRVILDHLQRLAPGAAVVPQPDGKTASN